MTRNEYERLVGEAADQLETGGEPSRGTDEDGNPRPRSTRVRTDSHGLLVINPKGWTVIASRVVGEDKRVVLCYQMDPRTGHSAPRYVTWQTSVDGDCFWGHYHEWLNSGEPTPADLSRLKAAAMDDFNSR